MIVQASETKEKVDALKSDNKELEDKITALGQVFQKWYPPYKQNQNEIIPGDEIPERRVYRPRKQHFWWGSFIKCSHLLNNCIR